MALKYIQRGGIHAWISMRPYISPKGSLRPNSFFIGGMYQLQIMEYAVFLEKTTMEVFIPVMVWVIPKVQIYLIHPLPSI